MQPVDLTQFYGLPGLVLIESLVKYLTDEWELPTKLAPIAAIVLSFAWNLLLGFFILHTNWQSAFVVGLLTAMGASTYHEVTK